MSSGEKAKPQATYEERNPFDISRRSKNEVATEIAKRMAAWKQARGRSYAAPAAPARNASSAAKPPVEPANVPPATPTPQRDPTSAGSGRGRAPFFASFSVQRAMPPAPALKQAATPPAPPAAAKVAGAAAAHAPPEPEVAPPPNPSRDDAPTDEARVVRAEPPSSVAGPPETEPTPGWTSRRDAQSTQTPDPEQAPADRSTGTSYEGEPGTVADGSEAPQSDQPAASARADDAAESRRAHARAIKARWMAAHDFDVPRGEEARTSGLERTASATPKAGNSRGEAPAIASPTPAIEALDEAARHREPGFDASPRRARPVEMAAALPAGSDETRDERPVSEATEVASAVPPIEVLDEMSGRREPTFDEPLAKKKARRPGAAAPAAAAASGQRTEPRAIETRIEARRIDAAGAAPRLSASRSIFPRIELEPWDAPPPVAGQAHRARRGAGWAMALGGILLIVGITAPAAIWRQDRQDPTTDQVAIDPVPLPPQEPAPQPSSRSAQPALPQADPQPEPASRPPAAPASTTERGQAANLPPAPGKSEIDASGQKQQPRLGPVRDGGELAEAPVSAPPPPWKPTQQPAASLQAEAPGDSDPPPESPMVARPFVPEQEPKPFLPAPTTGGATVAIDRSQPVTQSVSVGIKPALSGQLKPNAAAIESTGGTAQKPVRRPRSSAPQTLDQMFQDLMESLSNGQHALHPAPAEQRGRRE